MEIKYVRCPKCQVVLQVKNSTGVAEKIITCPKCNTTLKILFRKESSAQTATTVQDEAKTRLATSTVPTSNFHCVLEYSGKKHLLKIGNNTIGRKSSDNLADIMIETTDRSMSRRHAIINVSKLPNGSLKAVIRNDKNKNQTFVNNVALEADDRILLNNNDIVKMGNVMLNVKITSNQNR